MGSQVLTTPLPIGNGSITRPMAFLVGPIPADDAE